MRIIVKCCCLLILASCYFSALAQTSRERKETDTVEPKQTRDANTEGANANGAATLEVEPSVTIHLVDGTQMSVDEVTESADGIWFKRGNVSTFLDRAKVQRIERHSEASLSTALAPLEGTGRWRLADATRVKEFFSSTFKRPLPLTAFGQSELHDRWGLDHRNGMDVGLHPDSVEGRALIEFLRRESIPFMAFRSAIPGVATGPHIHIGNRSPRLAVR